MAKLYLYDVKGEPMFHLVESGMPPSTLAGGIAKIKVENGKRSFLIPKNSKVLQEMSEEGQAKEPGGKATLAAHVRYIATAMGKSSDEEK